MYICTYTYIHRIICGESCTGEKPDTLHFCEELDLFDIPFSIPRSKGRERETEISHTYTIVYRASYIARFSTSLRQHEERFSLAQFSYCLSLSLLYAICGNIPTENIRTTCRIKKLFRENLILRNCIMERCKAGTSFATKSILP